jgi:ABC-type transport system involved in Fe-S cluster assembly fused permease/ATPase subunit
VLLQPSDIARILLLLHNVLVLEDPTSSETETTLLSSLRVLRPPTDEVAIAAAAATALDLILDCDLRLVVGLGLVAGTGRTDECEPPDEGIGVDDGDGERGAVAR